MNKKTVYVVHCVDTEGPLHESIKATFERIEDIFGFSFEPSQETLKKLQNKEIDLGGKENEVQDLVAPKRITFNDTWDKIDRMLDRITSKKFRKRYSDSFGMGWVYSWFCVDHVGLNGGNPRKKDIGYHNIFDHYGLYLKLNKIDSDLIQWHYHPLAIIPEAHRSGNAFLNSSNIFNILARKVIEKLWFPAVYRPGFHTERPDSHWFLEQWIPFDYGNQASRRTGPDQPDSAEGRYGDWRRAPKEWKPYHPDFYDYQKRGNCNRYITRCLNMDSRIGKLTLGEIREAFKEAEEREKSLLAFTNHDFRDMRLEIDKVWKMIHGVAQEFRSVDFKFVDAIEGMRKTLGLENLNPPEFDIDLEKQKNKSILKVEAKNNIFGVQPFLAIKTKTKSYFWENFDFQEKNKWSYVFDFNNIKIEAIDKIGIASNTPSGVTEVLVLNIDTGKKKRSVLNK